MSEKIPPFAYNFEVGSEKSYNVRLFLSSIAFNEFLQMENKAFFGSCKFGLKCADCCRVEENYILLQKGFNDIRLSEDMFEHLTQTAREFQIKTNTSLRIESVLSHETIVDFKLFLRSDLYTWISNQHNNKIEYDGIGIQCGADKFAYDANLIHLTYAARGREVNLKKMLSEDDLGALVTCICELKMFAEKLKQAFIDDTTQPVDKINLDGWTYV